MNLNALTQRHLLVKKILLQCDYAFFVRHGCSFSLFFFYGAMFSLKMIVMIFTDHPLLPIVMMRVFDLLPVSAMKSKKTK